MKTIKAHNTELTGHYEYSVNSAPLVTTSEQAVEIALQLQALHAKRATQQEAPMQNKRDDTAALAFLAARVAGGWSVSLTPEVNSFTWSGDGARVVRDSMSIAINVRRGDMQFSATGDTLSEAVAGICAAARAMADVWGVEP